jgi:uncharacterized membrane protein YcjF (UPF0283 family)
MVDPDVPDAWRELHRCHGLLEARAIVTSIAAMEFDVRVRDATTGEIVSINENLPDGTFIIETQVEHAPALADVLDQIIDEQVEFDATLDEVQRRTTRWVRRVYLIILLLIALAVMMLYGREFVL